MSDVVVNIKGSADQLKQELASVASSLDDTIASKSGNALPGRSSDSSRGESLPPDNRLLDEVRAEIEAQRGISTSEAIDAVKKIEAERINDDISKKYDEKRSNLSDRRDNDYDAIDKKIEDLRAERLENLGPKGANDPMQMQILEMSLEKTKSNDYEKVGKKYDEEEDKLNKLEQGDRFKAEQELTQAIKDLKESFDHKDADNGDPNSYINQLRSKRKEALLERNNAMSPEDAIEAQKKVDDVEGQLKNILTGGKVDAQGKRVNGLGAAGSALGAMNAIGGGDLSGGVMGIGGSAAALAGTASAAIATLGVAAVVAGIVKSTSWMSGRQESLGDLARIRSTNEKGFVGEDAVDNLKYKLRPGGEYDSQFTKYGLSRSDYTDYATKRIRASGTSEDWNNRSMESLGLEKSLNLESGSMIKGSQFDRYGQNVNDAMANLVTRLSNIKGSGVSSTDFTRVQEKFDIQQSLMSGYMSRTDKPNYDVANRTLAGFSSMPVQQDARIGSDIQTFQGMVQNPMNDRMQALVFSTVSDMFPKLGGRTDLIDQKIRDPENEGKILQAVMKRITQQFGGTDTQMGYWAMKSLTGGNIAPDRLSAEIKSIIGGKTGIDGTGSGMSDGEKSEAVQNKAKWLSEAPGYTAEINKATKESAEYLSKIWSYVSNNGHWLASGWSLNNNGVKDK